MSNLRQPEPFLTFAEYLEDEKNAEFRHEFVDGKMYLMAGATASHNRISGNAFSALDDVLHNGPCRPFIGDVKLRVRDGAVDHSYYPDVFVTCDKEDNNPLYKERPDTIIEVLSNSTEATDRREKFRSYTGIPSLNTYILLSQKKIEATVYRRINKWMCEIYTKPEDEIILHSLKLSLNLARLYRNVDFSEADPPTDLEIYHPDAT